MTEHAFLTIADRLSEFQELVQSLRSDPHPQAIHALRVTSRKIDVWLLLGDTWVLRSDLRWLRSIAGAVRDPDVLLTDPTLPPSFREWLEAERLRGREQVIAACASERTQALLRALGLLVPPSREVALRHLRQLARRTLKTGTAHAGKPPTIETTHRLRRRLKAVRYGLEWLSLPRAYLEDMQDRLGAVNDRAMALMWLNRSELAASLMSLHSRLDGELRAQIAEAWTAWKPCALRLAEEMETWTSS